VSVSAECGGRWDRLAKKTRDNSLGVITARADGILSQDHERGSRSGSVGGGGGLLIISRVFFATDLIFLGGHLCNFIGRGAQCVAWCGDLGYCMLIGHRPSPTLVNFQTVRVTSDLIAQTMLSIDHHVHHASRIIMRFLFRGWQRCPSMTVVATIASKNTHIGVKGECALDMRHRVNGHTQSV
jgi:hypothetical protein